MSIASVADTKSIPNFRNSSSADTSCRNDLANRSNFQLGEEIMRPETKPFQSV